MVRKECDNSSRHRKISSPYGKVFDENKVQSTVQIIPSKFFYKKVKDFNSQCF